MKKWLRNISAYGSQTVSDSHLQRRVVFSNLIFITLPFVYFIFMLLNFDTFFITDIKWVFDQFIVPIIILICMLCLALNKWGYITISRILFLVFWPLLLHIIPIITQQTPTDYYLAYPLGIIFHGILIQIAISYKREPFLFSAFLAGNLVLMIFAIDFLSTNDLKPLDINVLRTDPFFTIDGILYWLLFNLLVFYLLLTIEDSIDRISAGKKMIEYQKEQLSEKNQELEQAVESLKDLNHYIENMNKNLEENIELRTKELQIKNQKLVEYANYNAHQLRGPFCRIKGLINLQKELQGIAHTIEFEKMLATSLDELDDIIHHIQKTVETEQLINSDNETNNQKT